MFLCVVDLTDVIEVYFPTSVCVKLLESLLHESQTIRIQFSSNDSQELIILDRSITVFIESNKQSTDILICDIKLGLNDTLSELGKIQSTVPIIVHNLEDSSNSDN